MIRGWRNDPRWVEVYKRRDEDREKRAIERAMAEMLIQESLASVDGAIRRMQFKPTFSDWS